MKLHADWSHIAKRSWAVRWAIMAGLLSAAEVVLPMFVDAMPRKVFALLSIVATAGAIWARLLVQPKDGL